MTHKIALVGFGTVGQGLVEILQAKQVSLVKELQEEIQVVGVVDLLKGSLYHPDGLDLGQLLRVVKEYDRLDMYPTGHGLVRDWDSLQMIQQSNADTIVEVTYTDVQTGQPGLDHCRAALAAGKHVVTSNKGPIARAYPELIELARRYQVELGFEGTVMSGTPALRMPKVTLAGNEITEIRGILNGTTNYMLTRMEAGLSYAEALQEAQSLGYAEADPTSDVEGYDVLYKVLILAQAVLGVTLDPTNIERQGITELTSDDFQVATAQNRRLKLVARVHVTDETAKATIKPEMLALDDPLAHVAGAMNAICYECDLAGPILLSGPGAGRTPTGFSLLIDLIHVMKRKRV